MLVKEADSITQNTSTTGMHKDVLDIPNNDHTFGISDKGKKNLALCTHMHRQTFGKTVHLYCEKD
jgi:hypothetical protein